jgi:hypothetical protein
LVKLGFAVVEILQDLLSFFLVIPQLRLRRLLF